MKILVGHVTSGTMVPYWVFSDRGILSEPTDEKKMRSIALAYIDSDLKEGQRIEILQRGKKFEGMIVERHLSGEAPPYARPILIEEPKKKEVPTGSLKDLTERLVSRWLRIPIGDRERRSISFLQKRPLPFLSGF